MNKKILLIKGISQYDAMRIYIDELAQAFTMKGFECIVLDGTAADFEDVFLKCIHENQFKFVFTCNGVFMNQHIFQMIQTKFVTWIFDHPVRHSERLAIADENTYVFTCDRDNKEYIREHFLNVKHVEFVPMSGSYLTETIPYEKRSIELLFTGSNLNPNDTYQKIQALPGVMRDVSMEMIEVLMVKPYLTVQEALAIVLTNRNLHLNPAQFHSVLFDLKDVGLYIRGYMREQVMKTVVEAGIPIHVFGNGWDSYEFSKKSNFIQEQGFGEQALKAAANAKISLNVMPWFKAGFQERIATAMLSGAVALTDTSKYIDENFVNGNNIQLYSLERIAQLPDIIHELLTHTSNASKIAEEGQRYAMKNHTWEHRAQEILAFLERENVISNESFISYTKHH